MINFMNTKIGEVVIHQVGNKTLEEGVMFSKNIIILDEETEEILIKYFCSSFCKNELFNFTHETDTNLNEVFYYADNIFNWPKSLHDESINIAKHLYEQSVHPKIKGGIVYIATFKDVLLDGEPCNAIGIFKSEHKDTYLKNKSTDGNINIDLDRGININILDKGCFIFDINRKEGYKVAVIDNLSKGGEALYWIDDFLHLRACQDDYHHTKNLTNLIKSFVKEQLPNEYEISGAVQAEMLNNSNTFLKDNDSFSIEDYSNEIFKQPEIIEGFKNYKKEFENDRDVKIPDDFEISEDCIKKQAKQFKSVIKLDKNFHLYIHGDSKFIEQGVDETTGLKFYKLLYKEEN